MRQQTGSRNRGWLPTIGNRLSVVAGVALAAGMMAAFAPRAEAVLATGGTVTNYTSYGTNWTAHIFTSTAATSIVFSAGGNIEVLVVGGGGAGRGNGDTGVNSGSGGNAGQLVYIKDYSVSASSYPVIVGLGGTGVSAASGGSGSNSVFGSIPANGPYITAFGITALGGAGGTFGTSSPPGTYGGYGAGGTRSGPGDGTTGNAGGPGLAYSISGSKCYLRWWWRWRFQ
jgi:hypothetical protein